ncbi:ACT domain-containing protein [Leeia oryzae]|uniref:ACT domain-containing protein n=1 Tax=Leeia oryzae TaxID=356662 RepID=UPI00035F4217|nr:ACT domain-containing protein [Leeia oryzae]
MKNSVSDLDVLLSTMAPELHEGVYVFTSVEMMPDIPAQDIIASMKEAEGLSLILSEEHALRLGLPVMFRAAWISLTVHSDLQAVGLTAAFAAALGAEGISCNVVAGAFHDHIFVQIARAQDAMNALVKLQRDSLAKSRSATA